MANSTNGSKKASKVSVLIVGAGPTGLVLAFWLKKRGIDFRLIDKKHKPGETSRALAVQARTLEFYRMFGLADQLIDRGIIVRSLFLRYLGNIMTEVKLGALGEGISPFPYLLFCSQDVHEQLLSETLEKMGVEIERDTELTSLTQEEGVTIVDIKSPSGQERILARYVCGCDGAHSTVRHEIATPFSGGTYSQLFYVADVGTKEDVAKDAVQVSVSPKDFCIVMPIKSLQSTRLTGLIPPDSEQKTDLTIEDVRETVRVNTGLNITKVNWFSIYHVHHRVADRFREGRVFLLGDAAHIHSPAGGQGMNTGIGDAVNLGWKLADVIQGKSSEYILDSYEIERRAFAKILIATTDTAFRFLTNRSWIGMTFRSRIMPVILPWLTRFKFFVRLMFRTISQTRIRYRHSPLSSGYAGRIVAGDRLPWVPGENTDNFEPLLSMDWHVQIHGQIDESLKMVTQQLGLALHAFKWSSEAAEKGFAKDAMYLVRPDGHVALALETQDATVLRAYWSKKA